MIEWLAAVLSALGVALTARRSLAGWPVSFVACLLYGWVFYRARLYADTVLQAVFGISILYGWALWQRAQRQSQREKTCSEASKNESESEKISLALLFWPEALCGITLAVGAAVLWGLALRGDTDDPYPFLDAGLSCASLLAQFWMARRYRACWLLWAAIDLAYTGLFLERDLRPTALLYACFVGLAVYGWRQWKSTSKNG